MILEPSTLKPLPLLENFFSGACFLTLSGPSLATHDLTSLNGRGIMTMGVNNSWLTWRPRLWTCVDLPSRFSDVGWRDSGIMKFVPVQHHEAYLKKQSPEGPVPWDLKVKDAPSVLLYSRGEPFDVDTFLMAPHAQWGCNSRTTDALGIKGKRSVMLVAMRLLYYLGFRSVYLLGADFKMSETQKYSFPEGRTPQAIHHNNLLYESLDKRFTALQPKFLEAGFTVKNCTPGSGLTAFPYMVYEDAVAEASMKILPTTGDWYSCPKTSKI